MGEAGWRGAGSHQPAVTPHDHTGAQLVHLGRLLRRRDCVPGKPTCWGQLSETPSLAARLPVSPVPGRVVCAAGNDIVSGHLLAARSPVHCAVHLLRRGGNRGGPGAETRGSMSPDLRTVVS